MFTKQQFKTTSEALIEQHQIHRRCGRLDWLYEHSYIASNDKLWHINANNCRPSEWKTTISIKWMFSSRLPTGNVGEENHNNNNHSVQLLSQYSFGYYYHYCRQFNNQIPPVTLEILHRDIHTTPKNTQPTTIHAVIIHIYVWRATWTVFFSRVINWNLVEHIRRRKVLDRPSFVRCDDICFMCVVRDRVVRVKCRPREISVS